MSTESAYEFESGRQSGPVDQILPLTAAAGSVGEAVVHIPVIEPHLTQAPYLGVGFLLLSIAGVILAINLVRTPSRCVWGSTGAVAALAIIGYVLSRTVGLPQAEDDIGDWGNPLGTAALICEVVMLTASTVHFGLVATTTSRARTPVV